MKVLIVLPTYNEAVNILLMMPELLKLPAYVEICVVDDNSPDNTGQLAEDWAAKDRRVHVLHRAGKLGLGTAYIAGFHYAFVHGFDAALTMDADFSHHPRYIPAILAAFSTADLVIGSRYVSGGDVLYPWHRRFLSKASNLVARTVLGLNAHDCTAGFRLYRVSVLQQVPLDRIFSNGYSFLTELLTWMQAKGARITEVPIVFEDRQYGVSKISTQEIFKGMWTVARLAARRFNENH